MTTRDWVVRPHRRDWHRRSMRTSHAGVILGNLLY